MMEHVTSITPASGPPAAAVLLVDDRPDRRGALAEALGRIGCRVVCAGSGREALAAAGREEFAVLVLGAPWRGMSGAAAALRAHEGARSAAVLFLRPAGRHAPGRVEAYTKGGLEFLTEPVDVDVLRAKVAGSVELWQLRRRASRRGEGPVSERGARREPEAAAESEARLRESEAKYREIVETAQEGVWLSDGRGVTTYANRRMAEMLGYEPEALRGRHFSEFMDAAARAEVARRGEWTAGGAAGGAPKRFDARLAHREGRDVWTMVASSALNDGAGRRVGVLAMVTDVTERRLDEERSRALNEVGRALASSARPREMAEAVARALVSGEFASSANVDLLDGGDGRPASAVAHADPAKDRLLRELRARYPPDERRHPSMRAMRSEAPVLLPVLTDDALLGLAHDEGHLALLRQVAPATLIVVPLVARGRVFGALGVGGSARRRPFTEDDLTWANDLGARVAVALDNARLLAEAQRERRRAEEAGRAKDEFLAVVSHELRTPLNAILGWGTMLRAGELGEADQARAFASIERNARALARLIEDLLDVSRVVAGKLELDAVPVDLAAIVEAAVDTVRHAAEAKGVGLGVDLGPGAAPAVGDPQRLQQVVWNLLSNAIKFTPRGGRVQVRLAREGARWALRVEDTGRGIDAAFLPHAFERFRQADSAMTRSYGGLGLGLSIVKCFVELHGGVVRAESAGDGKGAAFVVRLPDRPPGPGAAAPAPGRGEHPATPGPPGGEPDAPR
ncbi:MAG TPA: ATP-binding protein [Polyangiaceae bacterium]|nr:ATP-binding protein [Polyangiaceae bacterium]